MSDTTENITSPEAAEGKTTEVPEAVLEAAQATETSIKTPDQIAKMAEADKASTADKLKALRQRIFGSKNNLKTQNEADFENRLFNADQQIIEKSESEIDRINQAEFLTPEQKDYVTAQHRDLINDSEAEMEQIKSGKKPLPRKRIKFEQAKFKTSRGIRKLS